MSKNNINKNKFSTEVVTRATSLVIALSVLLSSYAYILGLPAKSLKGKKDKEKNTDFYIEEIEDKIDNLIAKYDLPKEKILASTLAFLSNSRSIPEKEENSKLQPPLDLSEETLNNVSLAVADDIIKESIAKSTFANDESLQQFAEDAVTLNLIKWGLKSTEATNEEKINWILKHYRLTLEQFKVVVAVVIAESKWHSYEDGYAVINTIYNRTICKRWVAPENGVSTDQTSLYNQVTRPGQFTVYFYGERTYRYYLDATPMEYPEMQAVIDFLYGTFDYDFDNYKITWNGPARMHDYLQFLSSGSNPPFAYEQFTNRGNKYGSRMQTSEYLTDTFTEISTKEVEEKGRLVEAMCEEYQNLVTTGVTSEEAMRLVKEKSQN